MDITEALIAHLLDQPGLTAIVGSVITREYVSERDSLPYVMLGKRGQVELAQAMDGSGGVTQYQIDIEARAKSFFDAQAMVDIIRQTIHGFTRGTWGSLEIASCWVDDVSDDYEALVETDGQLAISAITCRVTTDG